MPSIMNQEAREQREALAGVHPSLLLAAIRAGAKPRVEDHLVPAETELETLSANLRNRHREEVKAVKAAVRQLDSIRSSTPARVDDHLAAEENELCRSKLTATTLHKHREEATAAKAARRRLEAIRHGASAKVEDHQSAEVESALEDFGHRKSDKLREERRQLKAHGRRLKAVRTHAEAKISMTLDAEIELARGLGTQKREERKREQAREARRVKKALHAIQAGDGITQASDEMEDPAANILRAARRGSLARSLHTPGARQQDPSLVTSRVTDRLTVALNNRLAQRREAMCGAMLTLGKAQGLDVMLMAVVRGEPGCHS